LFPFWACLGLCTALCVVPYYGFYLYCELFHPTAADIVYQERYDHVLMKNEKKNKDNNK
jgi:hypothetical protein